MKHTDILDFWFSDRMSKHWFSSTSDIDNEIKEKFELIWNNAATGVYDHWQKSAEQSLALVIILDQLPLNMFRGRPESFATEQKAVGVSKNAIANCYDKSLSSEQLIFLFMPLMHSEKIDDQDLSVTLYKKHNMTENLKFALHHRDIVHRYGRFPHRNAILGRESSQAEIDYLNSKNAFKG